MRGACLCGAVQFAVTGAPSGVAICHCTQCRKQSGHLWASAFVSESGISITGEVKWFEATSAAKRGFCPVCGSYLFWKAHGEDTMSFSIGAIEPPTALTTKKHIFTADKGDYYQITDGVPQT